MAGGRPGAPDLQYKDYYAVLGVPKTGSQADIKKAFRKLARQHHPDAKPGDAEELRPHVQQDLLLWCGGSGVWLVQIARHHLGCWKCLPVYLQIWSQWKGFLGDERRGHHVLRQIVPQEVP